MPVHVNNCQPQCRCSGPAMTAKAAWPRILGGQDGEEKSHPDIRGATCFFFELLHGDTVHRVKRKLVWTTRCRQPSSPRVVGHFV